MDDTGNRYRRGQRIRVCREARELLVNTVYADAFIDTTAPLHNHTLCCKPADDALRPARKPDPGHGGCCS